MKKLLLAAIAAAALTQGAPPANACHVRYPYIPWCWTCHDAPMGVAGVVEITPECDVYVLGELFWDSPPYEG